MTDGCLLRECLLDGCLGHDSVVILDEVLHGNVITQRCGLSA